MSFLLRSFYFIVMLGMVYSCANKTNCPGEGDCPLLQKVSTYSDDSIVAATYFSADTNIAALAKALWQEKNKLLQGKDSATVFYLLVFNKLKFTPDISADYTIAWRQDYYTYRYCTIDNGFGFTRFCYSVRLDEGRIGDWAHFRYVNNDGSLAESQ
ncbi:MAG: hypothetical protein POELPBGB_03229 [Bacteroidia bacterium]|nr:hypothetical protein [Bacteroidia bacterium]